MKLKAMFLAASVGLTGCIAPSGNYSFSPNLLPNELYDGYWAMDPENQMANVFEINRDGTATLYRFSCDKSRNYRTANAGTIGKLVEKLALKAEQKTGFKEGGDLVRGVLDIEQFKASTPAQNQFVLNSIGGAAYRHSFTINSISASRLNLTDKATWLFIPMTKHYAYTKVELPRPKC